MIIDHRRNKLPKTAFNRFCYGNFILFILIVNKKSIEHLQILF
jgi:hypothetical protein